MKICGRGYSMVQVCKDDGTVRPCGWVSVGDLGNLCESTMYEILHGERAEDFRQSLLDGSFRYCCADSCPYLANDSLSEIEVDYVGVPDYPKEISLAYDHTCNYKCTSCRSDEHYQFGKTCSKNFGKIEDELAKFINKVEVISANGLGEMFATPSILNILANWCPESQQASVILETNGSLFTESNWKKIENLGQYNLSVIVTVMSFEDAAYKQLSGVGYDTTRIVNNLHFIKKLRQKGIVNYFEIATVFQERNFRTLPSFSKRCIEEFLADRVRLRPFFQLGADIPEIEWFYDIRNEYHPYYKEFAEIMKHPIFEDPRIFHWSGHDMPAPRVHPGIRHRLNYEVMRDLFMDEDMPSKMHLYIERNHIRNVILYGIGGIGKAVISVMQEADISISHVFDSFSFEKTYRNLCIESPYFVNQADTLCIVNLTSEYEGIRGDLENMGYKNIKSIREFISACIEEAC